MMHVGWTDLWGEDFSLLGKAMCLLVRRLVAFTGNLTSNDEPKAAVAMFTVRQTEPKLIGNLIFFRLFKVMSENSFSY